MKKLYALTTTILTSLAAFAQPVFNVVTPPVGTSYQFHQGTTTITAGATGANQTWDYSTAGSQPLLTANWIAYSSVSQEMKDSFPQATIVRELIFGGGAIETRFFKANADHWLDYGKKNSGNSWNVNHTPDSFYVFPLNYGASAQMDYPTTYDAYGTLKTPFGTFSNIIRLKQYDPTGIGSQDTLYYYYQTAPYLQPIMNYVKQKSTGTVMNVYFYETLATGINDKIANNNSIDIAPNPNSGVFTITLPANTLTSTVQITNILGEAVYNKVVSGLNNTIDIGNTATGIYIIKVTSGNQCATQRFIKQ